MKCIKCGGEMEQGYVSLVSEYPSGLYWSKEEPPSFWAFRSRMPGEGFTILQSSIPHSEKKDWLRKASRCANCKLITFEY